MANRKVVLITGCSDGGLGSALALAFHKHGGYRVIATARNLSKLSETRRAGIEELELDVSDNTSIESCAKKLEALTGGRLDMLVNNAGAGYNMPVLDTDIDEARKVFDLNVWSLVTVSKAFIPLLMKTRNSMIVNQISVLAVLRIPLQGVYNASKAAAGALTENLRMELKPFGIRVIALMTGLVRSKFYHNEAAKIGKVKLPEDSVFQSVPGGLKFLDSAESIMMADGDPMDADEYARRVVNDLSKTNPPYQIWRGHNASMGRLISLLPPSMTDGITAKMTRFDEVENALKKGSS